MPVPEGEDEPLVPTLPLAQALIAVVTQSHRAPQQPDEPGGEERDDPSGRAHTRNWRSNNRLYEPPRASSSRWEPSSTMRPASTTTMRSARVTVDKRWAMTSVERPCIRL